MCDNVEFQTGLAQLSLQALDLADKLAGTFNIVATPVVGKYVERVLIAVFARRVPFSLLIPAADLQRVDQPFVDLNFGEELNDLQLADHIAGNEIIPVSGYIRRDRQTDVVVINAVRTKPHVLAGAVIPEIGTCKTRNDYDRSFTGFNRSFNRIRLGRILGKYGGQSKN